MNLLAVLARLSSMTMLSRVLGFIRDAVVARVFGAGAAMDAFVVAFRLPNLLRRIFAEHPIQSVIHFAALKAVGESVKKPLEYYSNNVSGSLILPSASPANRCWLRQSARWAASADG